ncbi:MAG: hypothetical protein J6S57_02035 [Alphaproteobacteria bacterium]|nr:hypothetical protein [Alphaproteobacteria bacterium]
MKKIALTSLIAMFAFAGAHAANVIDDNPLYMPKKGHFYSISDVNSHSGKQEAKTWNFDEEFGYGITNRLAIDVATRIRDDRSFDEWSWGSTSFDLTYRILNKTNWKLDLIGKYAVNPVWGDHRPFLEADDTDYTWTAGVRGGFTNARFTVAGHAMFNYENTESFNWNEKAGKRGVHTLDLGVDGQLVLCNRWNLVAGVEYTGVLDNEWYGVPGEKVKNAGTWEGMFGANFNIDSTKFVGAYVKADMNHRGGTNNDEWKVQNGFGFGAKFGIDF